MTYPDDGEMIWGGPEICSRQARLDAAYDAYEARHFGDDNGRHHRPYTADGDPDPPGWDEDPHRTLRREYTAALIELGVIRVRHDAR